MSRINSLSWGASASQPSRNAKKRHVSPDSPPLSVKRHRAGPFLVESDSEGKQGSEEDDDDGFNFDSHIAVTPKVPFGREAQNPASRDKGMLPSSAIMQQQQPGLATKEQQAPSTSIAVSPSGRSLNKDRLQQMMAKKPGGGGMRGSPQPQRLAPNDMRKRPLNGAQVSGMMQKQSWVPVMAREQSKTAQQHTSSHTRSSAGISSQGSQSEHRQRLRSPSDSDNVPGLSLSGAAPSHTQVGRSQKPTVGRPAHKNLTQARNENMSSSRTPNSSAARMDPARSNITANGSSLRSVLDAVKAEPGNAPKAHQHVGSEWRKVQAERGSATTIKSARRPEPGARYGHTLTARKASAVQAPAHANTSGSTPAKVRQLPSMRTQTPTEKVATYGAPSSAPRCSKSQTASMSHAVASVKDGRTLDQSRATENARQKSIPQKVRQTPSPAVLPDRPRSFSQQAGWDAHRYRTGKEADGKSKQKTVSPPALEVPSPSPETRNTANETTATSPSLSNPGDNPLTQASAAQTSVTNEQDLQDPIMASLKEMICPGSDKKSVQIQPKSFADGMDTSYQALQEFPAVTKLPFEQCSNFTTASSVAEPMEICQILPMTDVSKAPDSSSTSVGCAGRSDIPVAVMVCPPRVMLPPRPPRDQVDHALYASAAVSAADDCASLTKMAESPSPHIGEVRGLGHGFPAAAGRPGIGKAAYNNAKLCGSNDITSTKHSASPTEQQLVHEALSDPPQVVATDEREMHQSVPISIAALQPQKLQVPEPVNGVHEKAPSLGDPSSKVLKTVVAPAKPPMPPSPGVSQAKITTKDSLPPSLAQSSLLPPAPAMDMLPNSETSLAAQVTGLGTPQPSRSSADDLILPSPKVSPTSEPYFEYTVHQALASWSGEVTTEISVQPMTSFYVAITQMEKLLRNSKQQFEMLGMQFLSTDGRVDGDGLPVHHTTFQDHEDPSKIFTVKMWVQRAEVGIHANHTPSTSFAPPSVGKTVFAVRLWKLMTSTDEEGSDDEQDQGSDEDEDEKDLQDNNAEDPQEEEELERCYLALPTICTELHTNLSAANRAAKRVQVHMSHIKNPKTLMEKQWQIKDLQDMERMLGTLRNEAEEGDGDEDDASSLSGYEYGRRRGCWRSVFQEPIENVEKGNKVQRFEVLVCKVGLSGPRNL